MPAKAGKGAVGSSRDLDHSGGSLYGTSGMLVRRSEQQRIGLPRRVPPATGRSQRPGRPSSRVVLQDSRSGKLRSIMPLAADNCLPLSDIVCGGLTSVGFRSKRSVGCAGYSLGCLSVFLFKTIA
jgi:hypothetical protein